MNAKVSDWRGRFPFLGSAVRYLCKQDRGIQGDGDWALDRVWNGIDENYKLAEFIANSDFEWPENPPARGIYGVSRVRTWRVFWILAGYDLRRAVNEVYGILLDGAIDRYLEAPGEVAARLQALQPHDVVASANYDLLVERTLRTKWDKAGNYRNEEDARSRTEEYGPLVLKLHGSLDWDFMSHPEKGDCIERTRDGKPMTDSFIDYHSDGWEHRPLLIAPVRFKDEVLVPGAQPPVLVKTLSFQWARFVDALSQAEELTVLGYSFPPDDAYGNRMVQEAVHRRPKRQPLHAQIHVKGDCLEVRNRLCQILPPSSHIECLGQLAS